jgi:RNA polymerase sigma-70 factor, ECF subfamily
LAESMDQATSSFNLLDRIRNGDREALSMLFDRHRRRLAVLAHYRLGPQLRGLMEIDDVLQETLLKAYLQLDQFTYRTPGSFLRWLSRIMDHVIADTARYHGRQKRNAAEALPLKSESRPGGVEPADSRTPSRLLAQDEGLHALLRELDELPGDYREVILLTKIEGLSTQEVAERMGRSRETIALLLHRAIKRLRQSHNSKGNP